MKNHNLYPVTLREREKMVYDKYPVSKAEMKCRNEKRTMDRLRDVYRKKLMEQVREKREY